MDSEEHRLWDLVICLVTSAPFPVSVAVHLAAAQDRVCSVHCTSQFNLFTGIAAELATHRTQPLAGVQRNIAAVFFEEILLRKEQYTETLLLLSEHAADLSVAWIPPKPILPVVSVPRFSPLCAAANPALISFTTLFTVDLINVKNHHPDIDNNCPPLLSNAERVW